MKSYFRIHQICTRPRPHTNTFHTWARDQSDAVNRARSMSSEHHHDDTWRAYWLRDERPQEQRREEDWIEL